MDNKILVCLTFLTAIAVLGYAGNYDYEEAKASESNYCQMVRDGHLPDYNKNYKEVCND